MKDKTTQTIALITMILQGIAVFTAMIAVMFQKPLSSAIGYHAISDIMVIPSSVIFIAIRLALYVTLFWITQNSDSGNKTVLTIILIIISVGLAYVNMVSGSIESIYYGRRSTDHVIRLSAVNVLVTYATFLFTSASGPLFYIACGRYMVNAKSETTEE